MVISIVMIYSNDRVGSNKVVTEVVKRSLIGYYNANE